MLGIGGSCHWPCIYYIITYLLFFIWRFGGVKEVPLCRFHLSSLKLTYFVLSSWFLNISCLGSVTFVFCFFGSIDTKLFLYPSTSLSNPELPSADTVPLLSSCNRIQCTLWICEQIYWYLLLVSKQYSFQLSSCEYCILH